jgi:tetratricopeptide (TPR) repeat protein
VGRSLSGHFKLTPGVWIPGLRGKAYTDKGDFDRAIADFTREIEIEPDNADAYRFRSTAYGRKQNHEAALADYNKAIEMTRRKIQSGDHALP